MNAVIGSSSAMLGTPVSSDNELRNDFQSTRVVEVQLGGISPCVPGAGILIIVFSLWSAFHGGAIWCL